MGLSRGGASPRSETWVAAGLCLAAAGVPLTVNAFGARFHAAYHVLAFGLGLVVAADSRLAARIARIPLGIAGPFLALWLIGLASAPFSLDLPAALGRSLDSTAALVVFAIVAAGIAGRAWRAVVLAGLLGMAVVALWGILQRMGIHPFLDPAIWQPSRPTRPLGTHNLVGGYLAAWLPAALALALIGRGAHRAAGTAAFLLGLACFLESESRGAWLALAAVSAVAGPRTRTREAGDPRPRPGDRLARISAPSRDSRRGGGGRRGTRQPDAHRAPRDPRALGSPRPGQRRAGDRHPPPAGPRFGRGRRRPRRASGLGAHELRAPATRGPDGGGPHPRAADPRVRSR